MAKTFLAAVGDCNSPVTWSGIPYHFLQAARAEGLLDAGLPLATDGIGWKIHRVKWNFGRVIRGDHYGGFQYSDSFLEKLWSPVARLLPNNTVVNCFQLYPRSVVEDRTIRKWFFIDQTLTQLFDFYEQRSKIGRRVAKTAIALEHAGYQAAEGVIVHSRWAAASVMDDYGIPAERVRVVTPGANIDPDQYQCWEDEETKRRAENRQRETEALKLVFVGKDWKRKGLDRLLRALAIARRAGAKTTLRVIGCTRESLPSEFRSMEGVEWLGFLDKRTDANRFLRLVGECDVGCLLSHREAGGISFREYHALGLAVLGTNSGGAPEHMIANASMAVPTTATDEEIAKTVCSLERQKDDVMRLREVAWRHRRTVLWGATVSKCQKLKHS